MAERITKINRLEKSKEQLKLESLNEVTDAIVENKDSILKAIRIIKNLDDAKLLDAINGGIKGRQVIINKFATELNKRYVYWTHYKFSSNGIYAWEFRS